MNIALQITPPLPSTTNAPPPLSLAHMLTAGRATADEQQLVQGEMLVQVGDKARHLYEVVAGVLKLWTMKPDGQLLIIDFLVPGEIIGLEASSFHEHNVEAVGAATVRPIPRAEMLLAMLEHSEPADMFRKLVRRDALVAKRRQSLLGLRHCSQRMAGFVACIAERLWLDGQDSGMLALPIPRRDIARHLSRPAGAFCESLRQLADSRLIRPQHREMLEIPSLPGLLKYATAH
jgi:CRP-like cAMP-binding protein